MTTEATLATPQATEVARYRLLPEESRFTVQAFAEGLFSAFGHDPVILIRDFAGEVQFLPDTYANASLQLSVAPQSFQVGNEVKEKDRRDIERTMREEVLETTRYPEIVFRSNNISVNRLAEGRCAVRIVGDLSLHGTTQKNLWISAEASLTPDSLRATGNFSLKQTEFGIKPYSAAGGTIKLKNELKFTFEIVGRKEG
jgi:polyisoprenoid-binding protein YceI